MLALPRLPDKCRVLPGKIRVQGGAYAIVPATRAERAPLTVIFALRQDARRGRTPRLHLAGAALVCAAATARGPAAASCGCPTGGVPPSCLPALALVSVIVSGLTICGTPPRR